MGDKAKIESRRILYEDIKGDTELRSVIALLVLGGAAFVALNLIGHVIEGTAPPASSWRWTWEPSCWRCGRCCPVPRAAAARAGGRTGPVRVNGAVLPTVR